MPNPAPGTYTVVVNGFSLAVSPSSYTLSSWVPGANVGNATVAPATIAATIGDVRNITVNWTGLTPIPSLSSSVGIA